MRSDVYFLPPRTSVTDSVGIKTLPILSCNPKAATRDSSDSFTLRSNPEYEWMMYHFMLGLRGASPAAVPSALGCGVCGSKLVLAPASFFSSSCMIKLNSGTASCLVAERGIQKTYRLLNHVIDHKKVEAENKYRDHNDGGRGLHFFPRRGCDFARFSAHVVIERFDLPRPGLNPLPKTPAGGRD